MKILSEVFHSHAVPNLSAMEHERRSLARGSFPNNESGEKTVINKTFNMHIVHIKMLYIF